MMLISEIIACKAGVIEWRFSIGNDAREECSAFKSWGGMSYLIVGLYPKNVPHPGLVCM